MWALVCAEHPCFRMSVSFSSAELEGPTIVRNCNKAACGHRSISNAGVAISIDQVKPLIMAMVGHRLMKSLFQLYRNQTEISRFKIGSSMCAIILLQRHADTESPSLMTRIRESAQPGSRDPQAGQLNAYPTSSNLAAEDSSIHILLLVTYRHFDEYSQTNGLVNEMRSQVHSTKGPWAPVVS